MSESLQTNHNSHGASEEPGPMGWLCPACIQLLRPKGPRKVNDRGGIEIIPEGQSLESFGKAVSNGCLICYDIWRDRSRHQRAEEWLREDTWKPLEFEVTFDTTKPEATVLAEGAHFGLFPTDKYHADSPSLHSETRTSSAKTLDMAFSWLQGCLSSHANCKKMPISAPNWLPSRLIDVGLRGDQDWKLCITSEDPRCSAAPPYMTLSYRWGSEPQRLVLTRANLQPFCRGQPIEHLPQTFRDVVLVARHFGVRYVWIDCLCIFQDSSEDWEAEAPTMRHTYANSTCNILASASDDPKGGLFRDRSSRDYQPSIVETTLFSTHPRRVHLVNRNYFSHHHHDLNKSLLRRGWILQERFLAPRLLWFTSRQILWGCRADVKCEGFPRGIPDSLQRMGKLLLPPDGGGGQDAGKMSDAHFEAWTDALRDYSSCELTHRSDRLFAFAGVAQYFQEVTGDKYLAGIWKSRTIQCLNWHVMKSPQPKPSRYRAPSWSWAAVDGAVMPFYFDKSVKFLVEVEDVGVTEKGQDATVDVVDGFLKLKGSVLTAQYRKQMESEPGTDWFDGYMQVKGGSREPLRAKVIPDYSGANGGDGEVKFLVYADEIREEGYVLEGLILAAASETDRVYRRVGYVVLHEAVGSSLKKMVAEAEVMEITII